MALNNPTSKHLARRIVLRLQAALLLLLAATGANAQDCSDYPDGTLDGFAGTVAPSQLQIDRNCTIRNYPESNPLRTNFSFFTRPGQTNERWLIVFDNVVHSGNMSCNDVLEHKIWFTNGSSSKIRQNCQNLLIPVEKIDKAINIDQRPIGRTPRSNPATYTKVMDAIRDVFARLPEARARGYNKGRFSFNVKGGRCEACRGDGYNKIEMLFLADVYVPCEVCRGRRYNRATLEIRYKGYTIADVLEMSVVEALALFVHYPAIKRILQTLDRVGLAYIRLGQAATTLSGGEAQRIKLARELSKRQTGRTLYVLDEPTTGLHLEDIKKLLTVLQDLVDAGNTVIVIEHNLDVIKTADWIIDLGPEGGDRGGRVVAAGTPEQVAESSQSYTGKYLKQLLSSRRR